ncbi:MAG TPA: CPBP family glutamic-type intramembrane protease, partial [Cyanobium sp.]|nr:CPBP family glutamic-type intramembrane protease [Cyanobium sp.]
MAVCPAAVVALLTLPGRRGARWWKRQLTVGLIWPRPTPAALLGSMATMPLVVFLAAMVHGSSMTHLLELRIWTKALLLIGPLLLAAAAEEIGWTAWLLPRLAAAEGRWPAALLIGVTWGAWH